MCVLHALHKTYNTEHTEQARWRVTNVNTHSSQRRRRWSRVTNYEGIISECVHV